MEQGIERRESRRANYLADVEIEWGSSTVRGHVRNLSLGGMFIELANPLWVGAEFAARVPLEGGAIEMHCLVRRAVPEQGNGVEFVEISSEDLARLRQLIESLPY